MPLNLMILTSYFAVEPRDIRGGIGYRYVGLYASLVKALLNHLSESQIFWYSHTDRSLRISSQTRVQKSKAGMLKAVLSAISYTFQSRSYLAVIIGYPYAIPRIGRIFEYIFCLLVLKIFSLGTRVRVIVDDFDPPVEGAYAFSEAKPSTQAMIYGRTLDILTLKLASLITTISEFWRQYLARIYHIGEEKIFVVSNGSLVGRIRYNSTRSEGLLTILYAGSAMKVKNIDKLVSTVAKLREEGLHIDLHIAGAKLMNLPRWVRMAHYDWPTFVDGILFRSDICVIPYPSNRLGFFRAVPAKLFDYMAAGKPIVSTDLKEVSDIIRMFNCGLVARDWKEFKLHLERLCHDRELAKKLGENGRRAVKKYFDYESLADVLLKKLVKIFEVAINAES